MPRASLPVWKTFLDALRAPFFLDARGWGTLGPPAAALLVAYLLPAWAAHGAWALAAQRLAALVFLLAAIRLGVDFQRWLLLDAGHAQVGGRWTLRDSRFALVLAVVGLALYAFWFVALRAVLPVAGVLLASLNSPSPWLAGAVIPVGVAALAAATYVPARLLLLLPATAVDHDGGLGRIWRISRGAGVRLLFLIFVLPLVAGGLLEWVLPEPTNPATAVLRLPWALYLALVHLSILAGAYRALSEQSLPATRSLSFKPGRRSTAAAAVFAVVLVAGALAPLLPGSDTGEPAAAGSRADPDGVAGQFTGDRQFLTIDKQRLQLRYVLDWEIADEARFDLSCGGMPRVAEARLDDVANGLLRARIAREVAADLPTDGWIIDTAAGAESPRDADPTVRDGELLQSLNDMGQQLGVKVTRMRVERFEEEVAAR